MAAPPALAAATAVIGLVTDLAGTAQANSAYNSAGEAAFSAAQYNSKLIDINLNRQLDAIALDLRTFSSTQKAQIAKSNISVTSKSALLVMSDSLSKFEKEVVLAKENAKLQKEQELFVARQQQESLRQQARARSIQGIANTGLQALSLFESLSS